MTLRSSIAVVWTALVLCLYLGPVRFDPARVLAGWSTQGLGIGPGLPAALGGHLRAGLAATVVLVTIVWGGKTTGRVWGTGTTRLAGFGLGLMTLGAAGLGLGLAGLIRGGVPAGLAVAAALLAVIRGRRWIAELPDRIARTIGRASGGERFAAALALATALAALPAALAPEVTYDALAVHLGAPLEWLKAGKLVRLDRVMYADLPLLAPMLYLFALPLGGDGAAKLVHFGLGLVGIAAGGRLAARIGCDRTTSGWAVAIMAATPFVATLMLRANADLGVLCLVAAAAQGVIAAPASRRSALLAGCLAGGAASMKLTGGYAVIAALAVAGMAGRRKIVAGAAVLAGACAALVPWLTRTWLATGNPVYPFLHGWLGGAGWTAENGAMLLQDIQGENYGNVVFDGPWASAATPWLVTAKDRLADAALGPFALILIPLLLLGGRPARGARRLAVFAAVFAGCWAATSRDPRFLLPVWPALAALAAASLGGLAGRTGAAVRAGLAGVMILTPPFIAERAGKSFNTGPVVWGAITRQRYAESIIPPAQRFVPLALQLNALNPGRRPVVVVANVKGAWIAGRALYQSMPDTPHLVAWVRGVSTVDRLAIRFRQAGAAFVFYDAGAVTYFMEQFGQYRLTARERAVLAGFWSSRLVPLRWFTEPPVMLVYRVSRTPLPPQGPALPGWPE